MKYLKNLAIFVAVCMVISLVPVMTQAAGSVSVSDTAADPDSPAGTAAPSQEPQATSEPDASAEPETSAEPDATSEPSAEPGASAVPGATGTPAPTATAGAKFNIKIDTKNSSRIRTYVNSVNVTTAAKDARVTLKARASRGYNYTNVYYKTSDGSSTSISTSLTNSFETTFTMPASDIVIYGDVTEMTNQQLYTNAQKQYNDVNANIDTYTTRYLNNSSYYDANDIRDMRSYINSAKDVLTRLREEYTYFNGLIRDNDVTEMSKKDVISIQEELDAITDELDDLAEKMGGNNNSDYYEIDVTVSRGGRVVLRGAAEGTVNAANSNMSDYFTNVPFGTSLTLSFSSVTGYTLSSVRINNRNVSLSGSTLSISAANIQNYVVNGIMSISANFVYGTSGYTGSTYNGSSGSSGGSTYNSNPYYNGMVNGGTTDPTPVPDTGIPSSAFNDLADVEWAIPSINALSSLGIINGMGDGRFEPQSHVTREQFAKMIVGVMGYAVDPSATTDFSDDLGDWYTPYIAAAVQNGIITGRSDGTFGVGDDITRQDIAVIIYRSQGSPATEPHQFPDSGSISDYAVDAVSYMFNSGIASGDDQGNFNPANPATRAEASKMLYGLYNSINNK